MRHKIIVRIMLCFIALALVGCKSHTLSVNAVGQMAACKNNCQIMFKTCSDVCHNNCKECSLLAKGRAIAGYSQYMREHCVQGGIIARELKSYRDPLQCRKTTCNCKADYTICRESCAGLIHKYLQVPKACC